MQARRLKMWQASDQAINSILIGGLDVLRARSRQMVRDNPYLRSASEDWCTNLISTGLAPSSAMKDEAYRAEINRLWNRWAKKADADSLTDFYGLQTMIARALFEAGEIFVRVRPRRVEDRLPVPLQLQLLEGEHCPVWKNETAANGNEIRCGIEFDAIGRRVAYHMYRRHPGDLTDMKNNGELVRIPASEILHIYRPLRAGQLRGQPETSAAIVKAYLLDQYDDAELDRKKVAALYAGFIVEDKPEDNLLTPGDGSSPDEQGALNVALQPGTMMKLLPGESVSFSQPADVGGSYEAFEIRNLHAIAAGLGIPYMNLTHDLRQANYSSSRSGTLAYRRRLEQIQDDVIKPQFCWKVWELFIGAALLSGALKLKPGATVEDLVDEVEWIRPKWPWIDPYKEAMGEHVAVRDGFKLRRDVVAENGYDVEAFDRIVAEDQARADGLGLVYGSDARRTSSAGVGQDGRTALPGEVENADNTSGGEGNE